MSVVLVGGQRIQRRAQNCRPLLGTGSQSLCRPSGVILNLLILNKLLIMAYDWSAEVLLQVAAGCSDSGCNLPSAGGAEKKSEFYKWFKIKELRINY
ncbi:MAG: hypothetical protein EOP86_18055 [Verrucomicrobiaceae bacterium]|nr:MAG: hypothetical protein EOP86_18055 [Verrucomicrobiaceae bacterium]